MQISIHSARVGGDIFCQFAGFKIQSFQSTPPVWAETIDTPLHSIPIDISIHSARVGGDLISLIASVIVRYFNPLRPCGRRRVHNVLFIALIYFNPLRPCGRRHSVTHQHPDERDFNPLRPCGRRLHCRRIRIQRGRFQSTPPVWAETLRARQDDRRRIISIHSARVGGDTTAAGSSNGQRVFQSTPPVWAETCHRMRLAKSHRISIHSARVGGDVFNSRLRCNFDISIHSARVGGDSKRNHFFVS